MLYLCTGSDSRCEEALRRDLWRLLPLLIDRLRRASMRLDSTLFYSTRLPCRGEPKESFQQLLITLQIIHYHGELFYCDATCQHQFAGN